MNTTSLSTLAEAYRDAPPKDSGMALPPSIWTPAHVTNRLVDAYDALRRTPLKIWPKAFGNGWPAFMYEDEDRKDQEVLEREDLPTLEQSTLMEEALRWCFLYLSDRPMEADGLQLYCWCRATGRSMRQVLAARAEDAEKVLSEVQDDVIADRLRARNKAVAPKVRRRQIDENAIRKKRRDAAIARVRAWADERLERAWDDEERQRNIRANAAIRLEREIKKAETMQITVRRQDVVPDRVFSTRWLDVCRKQGAFEVAEALNRARVQVR